MSKQNPAKSREKPKIGSAFDLLGKSYNIVKKNWQAFAVVNILAILGGIFSGFDNKKNGTTSEWSFNSASWDSAGGLELAGFLGAGFAAVLLLIIVGMFLFAMSISLEVKSSAGKKPSISELFEDGKKYFFRIIGLVILAGLIIIAGFILLIIPGIIAIGRLAMSPYHLVDKDLGVIEALKKSNDMAIGNMGKIYGAIGVTIVVAIVASIFEVIPVIGSLFAVATTIAFSLVIALRYQQLKRI